ncbi:MAG TPA: hypothetical protein VKU80_13470, partial [Planctomycetota bacterium]|nr:hypothetical protein [Planctomycetota bacterium]
MSGLRSGFCPDLLRRFAFLGLALGTPWLACNDSGAGGGLQPSEFTVRVSTDAQGGEAGGASGSPSISDDGRYVVFESLARNLVPQDVDGIQDIFLKDRVTGSILNVSFINPPVPPPLAGPVRGTCSAPAISGDGQTVAFLSVADVVRVPDLGTGTPLYPAAVHATTNVFVYQASTLTLRRILQGGGSLTFWPSADVTDLSLSQDGRYLAFATGDTNMVAYTATSIPANTIQIYVADLNSGTIKLVSRSRSVANSGCNGTCAHPQISSDGQWVVYDTNALDLTADAITRNNVFMSAGDGSQTSLVSREPG